MKSGLSFSRAATVAAALLASLSLFSDQAKAAPVTIIVNGQQVQFDQPPIERSGRVFVPLRGVFEKLGATVVYDNGVINATGNGRSINLRIGSTTATVNGESQTLDVAPFLVGARTLVPLRFISQALGAYVNYDNNSNTVTVSMSGQGTMSSGVSLTNLTPAANAVIGARSPAVSGSFSAPVDPNSVKITLDGRDVSSTSDISANDFLFTPGYSLTPESHTVRVTGTARSGGTFDQSWSFTSGSGSLLNYITNLTPAAGSTVSGSFTLSGRTLPNSRVHIVVVPSALVGPVRVDTGTYTTDLTADGNGNFSQQVTINTIPGGDVGVRITATAPTTNAARTVDLALKS